MLYCFQKVIAIVAEDGELGSDPAGGQVMVVTENAETEEEVPQIAGI